MEPRCYNACWQQSASGGTKVTESNEITPKEPGEKSSFLPCGWLSLFLLLYVLLPAFILSAFLLLRVGSPALAYWSSLAVLSGLL